MVKHIRQAAMLLCISILSIHFLQAQEQERGGFDNRKVLYGIHWGFTENIADIYYSDIEGFAHPLDQGNHSIFVPGTRINVMYDVRLGNYFRLRVMPGVSVFGRTWNPGNISIPISPSVEYKVKRVCGELPVDVKFQAFNWDNQRLYFTSGISYNMDFNSFEKETDDGTIQRLNGHDLRYTCGVGLDFDTRFFRLGVELKATFGLPSPGIISNTRPDSFYYHSGPTLGFGFIIEA